MRTRTGDAALAWSMAQRAAADAAADAAPRRPVVLVVHGDLHARVGYAQSFERAGCTAVPADSVGEAVTALSRPWLAIDVVWLSLDLPDGRGETVLAIIRNTPRFTHIRAVAHIGLDDPDPDRAGHLTGYGAAGWLRGPCDFVSVWAALFPSDFNRAV